MRELFESIRFRKLGPANLITLMRIVFTGFLVYFILINVLGGVILFFLLAAITDFLDGWVARKANCVTELGKVLDPVADKIFILSLFTARLVVLNFWMWWIFIPLLLEELILIILGGLGFAHRNKVNKTLGSNRFGKFKFTTHCFIAFFLLAFPMSWYRDFNWLNATILSLVLIAAILGGSSIGKHISDNWGIIKTLLSQ